MRPRTALLLGVTLAACGGSPVTPDGTCVAVVNVDGVLYGTSSLAALDPSVVSTEPYLTVTRNTGCLDQGEPSDPLAHGESNFLDPGTTLHTIAGFTPARRLALWRPLIAEWRVLQPL